jgi:glycine/D-amino acid oxidase-like deaminating enzyme
MTRDNEGFDVAIVGAGIIGTVSAYELAPDHDVVVVDKGQVAAETTGRASGIVSTVASYHAYPDMAKHVMSFYRDFDGTGKFSFTQRERIQLTPPEMEETTRERAKESAENGFSTRFLENDELEEKYPDIFDLEGYVGGAEYEDTGWVDPYTLTMELKNEAEDRGAEFRTGVEVEEVTVDDGAVTGLQTENGDIQANDVIVAAGWWTRSLLEGIVEVPVYPFRWQAITLDPGWEVDEDYPMGYDPVSERYWRPEHNGNIHVGGGEYKVEEPGSVSESVKEEFKLETAEMMPGRLRGMDEAQFINGDTCPTGDATTPDMFPIMDAPDDAPDGLVVNTGYHIGGIMTAPAAGTGARSLVTGEDAPFDLEPFSMSRFDSRSADFEFGRLMHDHTSYE